MAYEDPSSPPQQNRQSRYSQSDPRYLQPSTHNMPEQEPVRSRGSSIARQDGYTSDSSRYSQRTKPINEAINSAFNSTHAADAGIPPELLERLTSQITANVIRELTSTNRQVPSSNASHAADNASSAAGSPPLGRASVYTPPSPNRPVEEFTQPSPDKPFPTDKAPPSPDRRAVSPLSQGDPVDESDFKDGLPSRPKPPQRVSTAGDMTVLEKIWGKLFDEQGEGTVRLGQLLRGIAIHLIEDYEPKHSLVVTPTKMQQYYQSTKISNEVYPWHVIFDDRTSSISRMLRELKAQHHLVQNKLSDRPEIPGLTPHGFATWVTILIKAHPEQEFERLAHTVVHMPISNPDDRKERFPKELTRRLFPSQADTVVATTLQKAMTVHCNLTLKTRTESSAAADNDDDTTPQAAPKSSQERFERGEPGITPVTSHASSSSTARDQTSQSVSSETDVFVDSEEENTPTPQPFERQRKPYVAQVGGGKNYESVDLSSMAEVKPTVSTSELRPPPAPEPKLGRSQSVRSNPPRVPPPPISVHHPVGSSPIEIPESRNHRTSIYRREGPSASTSASVPRRNRSPSTSKDYPSSRGPADMSDPYVSYAGASSTPTSQSFDPPGHSGDRDRRYREYESRRERFPDDRYDAARMAAYNPRDRDRDRERADMRPRGSSIAAPGLEGGPGNDHARAEEEYYRINGGYPPGAPSGQQSYSAGGPRRDERDSGYYQGTGPQSATNAHDPPSAYRDAR